MINNIEKRWNRFCESVGLKTNERKELHKAAIEITRSIENYSEKDQTTILRLINRKVVNKRIEQIQETKERLDELTEEYSKIKKHIS